MKRLYSILSAAILLGTIRPAASAAVEVSVDFFHDHLESYGDWREVGDYGYCWQPRDVDRDWRPYSDGHWVYTDAGWTWDSEEPYSWAVYHYGRWARVDQVGWVWVPGTEWGPAWVSWRRSPRHVGWAPLPPEAHFNRSSGFSVRVDADFDIGPANYSFVEVRNFGAPRLRTVFVEPRENITIINQTTNITRITYINNVVYNEGPQYDVISRETAQPIRRLKLDRREQLDGDPGTVRAEQLKPTVEGDSLRVMAPRFDTKPATAPRKVAPKVEKAEVDRGWKDAGPPEEVAKLRTKIKSEPAAPAATPPQPKAEKTAEVPPQPKPGKTAEAPGSPAPLPTPADEPVAKPGKPGKGPKPGKPVAETPANPQAPAANEVPPAPQPKKGGKKGSDFARPPGETLPEEKVQERKPKREDGPPKVEDAPPKRELPPAAEEKVRPGKGEARPKAPMPEARPEAKRPEPRPDAAPAGPPPQPAKEKGKGKGKKDEKKDDGKPDGAPQ